MRAVALARAASLGLPTTAAEDWRYVNVKPLANPAQTPAAPSTERAIPATNAEVMVRDGVFTALGPLQVPDAGTAALESQRLARETEAPACWSWLGDCRHARLSGQRSLTIHHHATAELSGWRLLLDLTPGADCELTVVHHCARGCRASVGLGVTLAHGARLRLHEVVAPDSGQLFIQVDARVERDASFTCTDASHGGTLLRWRGDVDLAATGAHADLAAIDQVNADDQAHRHLRVRHRVGPTTSTQLFKSVLDGHAIASFDGLVDVAVGADGANAEQLSRTLLLSPTARGDTRPQLDIHADEVKAGHGATIGQLDADEQLYLRMRGLDAITARGLLIDGFVREVTNRLPESARGASAGLP
jgi:hypothetical protein